MRWLPPFDVLEPAVGPLVREGMTRIPLPERVHDAGSPELPLDPDLLGPEVFVGADAALVDAGPEVASLALDRWRRAAGTVLESLALAGLARDGGRPADAWTQARAAEAVHAAVPGLGWLWPDALALRLAPEEGLLAHPRRLAWLVRWLGDACPDEPADVSLEELAEFARWVLAADGLGGLAPVPLPRSPPSRLEASWAAPAWSFRRLQCGPAPAAGLRLRPSSGWVSGGLAADADDPLLLVVREPAALTVEAVAAGPTGTWQVRSGSGGGGFFAARGFELTLRADGRATVTLVDGMAGPVHEGGLELASRYGLTGEGRARWKVTRVTEDGGEALFQDLTWGTLAFHPAGGITRPLGEPDWLGPGKAMLQSFAGTPFEFRVDGASLTVRGQAHGGPVTLHLERV